MTRFESPSGPPERLQPWIDTQAVFVERDAPAGGFEARCHSLYQNDAATYTEAEWDVIGGLYAEVDSFERDPALRDETDIDEEQLRRVAAWSLGKLRELDARIER